MSRYFLKHGSLDVAQFRFRKLFPDVMTEIEDAVSVGIRFGGVKVGPYQGYHEGVEKVIEEFREE